MSASVVIAAFGGLVVGSAVGALLSARRWRREAAARLAADQRARQAQQLAELGSMTGGLAHEIKNPLSTLGLNAQLIAEAVGELPDDQPVKHRLRARSEAVRRESERLRGILQDFLDYAGSVRLERVPLDAREVLTDMVDFLTPEAQRAGVRLRLEVPEQAMRVEADVRLLKQALLNLLLNAVQAVGGPLPARDGSASASPVPKGEVILRARPLQTGRDVRASGNEPSDRSAAKDGGRGPATVPAAGVVIEVIDTGPGISAENIEKIFRPYFTTKAGGTGLGLPTSRRYIEEHGGTLTVQSTPGLGTQFTITLPA